ncbi:MAG: hypothetical protein LBT11_04320, partial [Treponema sp.]|nr:hypothetical protein [Treponema sp.]
MYRPLLPVLLFAAVVALLPAQTGDEAAAERYAEWAAGAMAEGRWTEALEALERAQDFAAVSSDLSYMLAQ